jgi:hypothetical protein
MSWVRLPLFFGTLKIKPKRHLRREEIHRKIPMVRIGGAYFVWRPSARRIGRALSEPANLNVVGSSVPVPPAPRERSKRHDRTGKTVEIPRLGLKR